VKLTIPTGRFKAASCDGKGSFMLAAKHLVAEKRTSKSSGNAVNTPAGNAAVQSLGHDTSILEEQSCEGRFSPRRRNEFPV
jgi:hypothetical protein